MDIEPVMLGWLAGIIDGEGSLMILKSSRMSAGCGLRVYYTPAVAVSNTCLPILRRCHELVGGHITGPVRHSLADGRKPAYLWAVKGSAAEELVRIIQPLLAAKGEQSRIFLDLRDITQIGASKGRYGRDIFTSEELHRRETLRLAMQAANCRGAKGPTPAQIAALGRVRGFHLPPSVSANKPPSASSSLSR